VLGGAGAAGVIVATRDGDDGGDEGADTGVATVDGDDVGGDDVGGQDASGPVAAMYLDATSPLSALSFPFAEESPSLVAPCSDAGALDALPTTSSGAAGSTDAMFFSVVAGSFATSEDAEDFRAEIAAVEPCQYWHTEYLETLDTVESAGDEVWLYYYFEDRGGNGFQGVDVYIVSGKVVGVVTCAVWLDHGWPQCDEVVAAFSAKVYDVAATYG
jgi:hypothetical protein